MLRPIHKSDFVHNRCSFSPGTKELRSFLDGFADKMKIDKQEDFYLTKTKNIYREGSKMKLSTSLSTYFPEFVWFPLLFKASTSSLLLSSSASKLLREWFDWHADDLDIEQQEDWYRISDKDIRDRGGSCFLDFFSDNVIQALKTAYSEFDWMLWKSQLFNSQSRSRSFFDWFAQQLGIELQEEWYRFTNSDVAERGGSAILDFHSYSLCGALQSCFPEYQWHPWLFCFSSHSPNRFKWNFRSYFDWIADQLDIQRQEDWYSVSSRDIEDRRGSYFLQQTGGSLASALVTCYPEFAWMPWSFRHLPHTFWSDSKMQREYVDWIGEHFGIETMDEWLRVSKSSVMQIGGQVSERFLKYKGSWMQALYSVYPEYNWPSVMHSSEGQQKVFDMLQSLLPWSEIYTNYSFMYSKKQTLELDFFLPSLSLALEYQGGQHHSPRFGQSNELEQRKRKDEQKRRVCSLKGITLIEIPFWWQNSSSALVNTIRRLRPEIPLHTDSLFVQ